MNRILHLTRVAGFALLTGTIGAQTHKNPPPTDVQIESQVQQILQDEHAFRGSSILSSVNKGVITLTGNVRSEAEKILVSQDLSHIEGVKTILNNLNVVDNSFHPPRAPALPTGPSGPKVITLAQGTGIAIRLTDEINTKTAKPGQTFRATTVANLTLGSYTAVPLGTPVTGRIVDAKPAGRLNQPGELTIEIVSLRLATPTGPQEVPVTSQALSSKGQGTARNTSGSAVALFTHGKDIDLKPEQLFEFRTATPLEVTIMLKNGKQVQAAELSTAH